MNRITAFFALLALAGCDGPQPESLAPEAHSGEETVTPGDAEAVPSERPAATPAATERSAENSTEREEPSGLIAEDGTPTEGALDALLGERGCRYVLGKLNGNWQVGPEGATEIWEVSDGRVQIERGELREMRTLVAHSSIALELRDAATGTSRHLVLAQDEVAVHFGEGVGGSKTPLGFLVAAPEHHLLVTADRCLAYEVDECVWSESSARYRCALDEAAETLTIERLGSDEAAPLVLQLGAGVAVDRALRASVLRTSR